MQSQEGSTVGKESERRTCTRSQAENKLRWELTLGKITFDEFEVKDKRLLKAGKIIRGGRIVGNDNTRS